MSVFENHDPEALIDQMIDGRFRLKTEIARSSTSNVFVAADTRDNTEVTLRLFSAEVSRNRGDALIEQARAAATLSHPNILPTLAHGRSQVGTATRVYVVQQHTTGGSLQDMIDRGRLLTPSQAVLVGVEVCRALDHAHKRGLTHFDLRPSAIVFDDDRRARVSDMAVASVVAEDAWADTTSVSLERARYCSPEQANGEPFDEKSDVYALALVLAESVTGVLPFGSDSVVTTLSGRVDKLFPVSADLGGLASVLERAGRSDPAERSSAAETGRALVQAAPSLPRPAPLPIVSTTIYESDRTGEIARPVDRDVVAVDSDMSISDEVIEQPVADAPLIGRWIIAAVAALVVVVGGFLLF
ncbi:MAG: serine/threonine-protein kinase, partial [Actinomycetota bacterium]